MSNLSPVSSIPEPPATLNRDSESGVRLMQTAIFMAGKDSHRWSHTAFRGFMRIITRSIILLSFLVSAPAAFAQVTETPIAFDSAGKVRTLTPSLVQRFDLKPPAWPVFGDFREARLYAVSSGGRVLVVDRPTGAVERYALSDDVVASLQQAIDASMTVRGRTVSEERADIVSQPANRAFVRNQMLLTWL